jgi:hypothetical protein
VRRLRFVTLWRRFVLKSFQDAIDRGSMAPPATLAKVRDATGAFLGHWRLVMTLIRTVALVTLLCSVAAPAFARSSTRYLELINRQRDSVVSLAIADSGSDAFRAMSLTAPVHGGGNSRTIEIAGQGCRYDLRVGFRNGRVTVYRGVDVCRSRALRLFRHAAPVVDEPLLAAQASGSPR